MSNNFISDITESRDSIVITVAPNGYRYFIEKPFDFTIDNKISNWIHQLKDKTWSDLDSLYRIGSMISNHTFNSKIDWIETMFMVEKKWFIKDEAEHRKAGKGIKAYDGSFRAMIALGQELNTPEINNEVKARVVEKLLQYNFRIK